MYTKDLADFKTQITPCTTNGMCRRHIHSDTTESLTHLVFVNTACVGVMPPVRVFPAAAGRTGFTKAAMQREKTAKQFATAAVFQNTKRQSSYQE